MVHLIDKDALVAEIESLENIYKEFPARNSYEDGLKDGRLIGYKDTLYKIDTLEVNEVNLEKEVEKYLLTNVAFLIEEDSKLVVHHIAKHFFELGLKAKGE